MIRRFKTPALAFLGLVVLATSLPASRGAHEGDPYVWFLDRFPASLEESSDGVSTNDADRSALVLSQRGSHGYVTRGVYTSKASPSPRAFDTVFVSWLADQPEDTYVQVQVRFADMSGDSFTEWFDAPREFEQSLHGKHGYIQFRVALFTNDSSVTPRFESISVHATLSPPASESPPPDGSSLSPEGSSSSLPSLRIRPRPPIIEREQWGARPARLRYERHSPVKLVVHHSYSPSAGDYRGAASIRGIQNFHMDAPSHGWNDIGYHFLIGVEGDIYEGRPEWAIGAHAPPNRGMLGICLIGNFQPGEDLPSAAQNEALVALLGYLSDKYAIPPRTRIFGHRDFSSTSCPGDVMYGRLENVRRLVEAGGQLARR